MTQKYSQEPKVPSRPWRESAVLSVVSILNVFCCGPPQCLFSLDSFLIQYILIIVSLPELLPVSPHLCSFSDPLLLIKINRLLRDNQTRQNKI